MNSNFFHNILNLAIALTAALTAFFMATGCVDIAGSLDCSASWINPVWSTWAITGMGVLKVVINVARDGFSGLVKPQPPVEKD